MWTKNNIPDQSGKTVIVTGANIGVGYETALALYEAGAHVILACRSSRNAEEAITQFQQQQASVETRVLDLSSLESVQQFADSIKQKHQQLDILINNAAVMMPPESTTAEGYELQFGVNFLGHFALTGHLYPLLKASRNSRVVTVSSNAYHGGLIDFDNLKSEKSYDPVREYGRSKLANMMFAFELQRRITDAGDTVMSVAVQPGANRTGLARHMGADNFDAAVKRIGGLMEPWQGALPSLYAAVATDVVAGGFYEPDADGGYRGYPTRSEPKDHAMDVEVSRRLWEMGEEATGLRFPG